MNRYTPAFISLPERESKLEGSGFRREDGRGVAKSAAHFYYTKYDARRNVTVETYVPYSDVYLIDPSGRVVDMLPIQW